jgi:hypothetical protein
MSHWYRSKLGTPKEPLKTQTEHPLNIKAFDRWYEFGTLRACWGHPQVIVRVAVKLAALSVLLGIVSLALSCPNMVRTFKTATRMMTAPRHKLSVDDVLAWGNTYGDLLGKPLEASIERFGAPQDNGENSSTWNPSARTSERTVVVMCSSTGSVAKVLKVFARPGESVDALEVLKKAPLLKFGTGTYKDTLLNFLTAFCSSSAAWQRALSLDTLREHDGPEWRYGSVGHTGPFEQMPASRAEEGRVRHGK